MFENQGPVAAKNKLHTYIATVGLLALPEVARDHFALLNTQNVFEVLNDGTERLYATLVEELAMPERTMALNALGQMAQAAAAAQLDNQTERWMAIRQWAANELVPLPEGLEMDPPAVKAGFSYEPFDA